MPHLDATPKDSSARLSALANWVCARSADSLVVVDLAAETVIAADARTTAAWPLGSASLPNVREVLTPDAIAVIRSGGAGDLHSPFRSSYSADIPCWKFAVLIPGDLAVLYQPAAGAQDASVLESSAARDELTGLSTRASLALVLDQALAQFRSSNVAFAALFLDFDHFKRINDELGHLAGDELLRRAASEILHTVRPGDRAIRYGGDEFVIVIGGLHSPDEALAIARRVRDAASKPVVWRDRTLQVTASVGVAFVRKTDSSADSILERADQAMYRAKNLGRSGKIELD